MDVLAPHGGAIREKGFLDIPALDFFAQRFHRIGHIAQVRIDRERRLVGFQRVLIVADVLEDQAEPGERAEVARFARQYFANIGEGAAVFA